jgi:hypothetical protein
MLSVDNLEAVFSLSEDFSAPQLAKRCVLFALERHADLVARYGGDGYARLMQVRRQRQRQRRAAGASRRLPAPLRPPR